MINIEFYFDPSCPWCWVTSRWLVEVSQSRDVHIEWLPFSLAMKNGELEGEDVTGHLDTHSIAHKVIRMIEAIHEKEGISRGHLYTEFGKAYFVEKKLHDDVFMAEVLKRLELSDEYLAIGESNQYDHQIKQHLDNAIEIVGDDVGVPLIIFVNENGEKQGYFGPVLQGLPDKEEGLELFDGLSKLATSTRSFEPKRSIKGGAKVPTTKRVFENLN